MGGGAAKRVEVGFGGLRIGSGESQWVEVGGYRKGKGVAAPAGCRPRGGG